MAPHGGRIEHGTSQIAAGIAGNDFAYYSFEGLKTLSHDLHITSNHFDEPHAIQLAKNSDIVITLHGAYGKKPFVYFGGLHHDLKQELIFALIQASFPAALDPSPNRQGSGETNICNRGKLKKGVQIEMTQGFRKSLFIAPDYEHTTWRPNSSFDLFTQTIRDVLTNSK